ncbi:hypothetical protein [Coleofasciculus chthonoplastes]|uniref:hypothetical protein n=1 Tax=Coleofasciculus TaxID=669368 RepID=UPI0032F16BF3
MEQTNMPGSAVFKLLVDMAEDPEIFDKYLNQKDALIEEYDLTEEQKDLIRVGGTENYIKLMLAERAKRLGNSFM